MCESLPKEFEKTTEVLPFSKYGLSSLEEFRKAEKEVQRLEWLKKAGLTGDEIKLYLDNEVGHLDERKKIESEILQKKLNAVYSKISKLRRKESVKCEDTEPSTSKEDNLELSLRQTPLFPKGHPINKIKDLEESLFGHLRNDIPSINKRRKALRRLERKKKRVRSDSKQITHNSDHSTVRTGSLWDVKEPPLRTLTGPRAPRENLIGPKKQTMYTIKNNCIVKVSGDEEQSQNEQEPEADVVLPETESGEPLLEGTKMSLDDIRKIERFKDYEPGVPSKVVHLQNIVSTVTMAQLALLFQQYICDNGGPPHVQLLNGKMRGQAYVRFENYDVAISAVQEINGTIVNGYPIIAKFASNTV